MTNSGTETLSVAIERDMTHPPEKIWRALTQPQLLESWLMKNDFDPVVGHRFEFRSKWGNVSSQVLAVEPNQALSYTWAALGLESVVSWTLAAADSGTRVRLEQSGFRPDQKKAFQGAQYGWQKFLENLEKTLTRMD